MRVLFLYRVANRAKISIGDNFVTVAFYLNLELNALLSAKTDVTPGAGSFFPFMQKLRSESTRRREIITEK